MAELVGLVASIIQIAGAGAKLSTTLYHFADSAARADQDIADIAGDIELTANALDSLGKVFENENAQSIVSKRAVQDANHLIKRCEAVFRDISAVVDKRRKICKDGKRSLSALGKFSWPLKEQRLELLRRRLESLKNSLMLLLHVLQLANGQAKGLLEKNALEGERETIRQLHQREQESLKSLQVLEEKLDNVNLGDDMARRGFNPPSRIPTNERITMFSLSDLQNAAKQDDELRSKYNADESALADNLETSHSDATITDEEGEYLTIDELSQCVRHVQELLKEISALQRTFEVTPSTCRCPKNRVHKLYRRFYRKFESEITPTGSTSAPVLLPLPTPVPPSTLVGNTEMIIDTPKRKEEQALQATQSSDETRARDKALKDNSELSEENGQQSARIFKRGHSQGVEANSSYAREPPSFPVIVNSHLPTPVSLIGARSPLLSPTGDRRPSVASSHRPMRQLSEDFSSQDGDQGLSPRRNYAYRRSEEPPRNRDGKLVCKHSECANITFNRKCEWSKHMDKHDRPYKCNIKGCEKLQGFSYSGGLLRHEREVHMMHGGTKKSLFCPFLDCKRSSGSGFTRKENLAEHIRRVHRRGRISSDPGDLFIPRLNTQEDITTALKRKRISDANISETGEESDLRAEVKRLRREKEEKDAQLPGLGRKRSDDDDDAYDTMAASHGFSAVQVEQDDSMLFGGVERKASEEREGDKNVKEEEDGDIVDILLEKWIVPVY